MSCQILVLSYPFTPVLHKVVMLVQLISGSIQGSFATLFNYRRSILSKLNDKITVEQSDKYLQQLASFDKKQRLIRCRLNNGLLHPHLYIESKNVL